MERFDPRSVSSNATQFIDQSALLHAIEEVSRGRDVGLAPRTPDSADGTWLDEDLYLLGKPGADLKAVVLLSLEDLERSRPGRRRRLGWKLSNFEKRVECILANALRAHFYRLSERVSYSRGADFYRHKPSWMSGASMRRTVDLMEAANLLSTSKGQWVGSSHAWEGVSSTFWMQKDLAEFVHDYGLQAHHVGKRSPDLNRVVRMRGEKEANGKAIELNVDLTSEIARSAEMLNDYNCFAATFDVSADLNRRQKGAVCDWHEGRRDAADRQPGIKEPELFNCSLVRIFNDGKFEHGGRLYGAFWTLVPTWLRRCITINDEPTVELDYSGLSIRMIYHDRGIDYQEDPYDIEALREYAVAHGRDPYHYRNSVKKLIQALLNDEDDEGHPEAIKLDQSFRPRFTRAQVKALIALKHSAIVDAFGTGEGKRLQRRDSDLALDVIVSLMNEGILALPIHDSFLVASAHRDRLMTEMKESYKRRHGFEPVIKEYDH